jgi:hypothetical protein
MNDPEIEKLLAYLNEQSGHFSLEALRRQLLDTGYDPGTVDRAIEIHRMDPPEAPRPAFWPRAFGVLGINVLMVAAVLGIANLPRRDAELINFLQGVFLLLLGGELIAGLGLSLAGLARPWGLGLLLGFLLTVALPLLLLGICFVLFVK